MWAVQARGGQFKHVDGSSSTKRVVEARGGHLKLVKGSGNNLRMRRGYTRVAETRGGASTR